MRDRLRVLVSPWRLLGRCMAWLMAFVASVPLVAAQTPPASPSGPPQALRYLQLDGQAVSLAQVLTLPAQRWMEMPENGSLGYRPGTFWFRKAQPLPPATWESGWRLTIENPVLDDFDLWVRLVDEQGTPGEWMHWHLGDKQNFEDRPLQVRHFTVPLHPLPSALQTQGLEWVARVNTSSSVQFPTSVLAAADFEARERNYSLGYGAYIGLMAGLLAYNLILWLMVRERLYGWYVGWLFHFAFFVVSLDGLTFQYLWPHALVWNDMALVYFLGMAVTLGSAFLLEFLRGGPGIPAWCQRPGQEACVLAVLVLIACALPYRWGIQLVIVVSIALIVRAQALILVSAWLGHRPARLLLLAFSTVFMGGCVLALQRLGLISNTGFTQHATLIGSSVEVVLLSLVLGDRLSRARREAHAAMEMATLNQALSSTNVALMSSRRLAEDRAQALLQLQEKLKLESDARDRERLRFLASAVHDLKQPLQAISMVLKPIESAVQGRDIEQAQHLLGLAQRATQGMRDQLASLLDLSRLESGIVAPEVQTVDLKHLVDSVMPTLQELAERQGVQLVGEIPTWLGVRTDEQLLRRVVLNLATNGIKYAAPERVGQRWLSISVIRVAEQRWCLRIADNGIGIAPEHIQSGDIFRPFFQVHNHLPEDIKGVGLGLSIVNSIVRLLPGHQLRLRSTLGEGTCFEIDLPASQDPPGLTATGPVLRPQQLSDLDGKYLLVVEDDHLVRESLSLLLRDLGVQHEAFAHVSALREGLALLERVPDGVICDYRLPDGQTGLDALQLIHAALGALPCLMVSAEKLQPSDFLPMSPVVICTKPLHPDDLIAALHQVLHASQG